MDAPAAASAAATPASASSGTSTIYSEQLFFSLLTHINPTAQRIEALSRLALRHLPQSPETWAAVRKAFVAAATPQSLEELDGPRNRSLWCLVDSLLKHAPHVFAPLVGPRLLEYTAQQTPLQLMSSAATAATTRTLFGGREADGGYHGEGGEAQRAASWRWWEALILSWEPFLPTDVFAVVRQYVVQRKSTAELDGALANAAASAGLAGRGGASAANDRQHASEADLQLLQEEWEAMRYLCANTTGSSGVSGGLYGGYSFEDLLAQFAGDGSAGEAAAATAAKPSGSGGHDATAAASSSAATEASRRGGASRRRGRDAEGDNSRSGSGSDRDDGEDEDEDAYVPNFIAGAKARQLPDRGLPAQRKRREAARRPREDDY